MENTNEIEKKLKDMLDVARWQGRVDGMIEAAILVMDYLNIEGEERRIEIVSKCCGITKGTTKKILSDREALEVDKVSPKE